MISTLACQWNNKPLQLVCFVFPKEVPGETEPLSFHKLCVDMHVNKTKFERNSSLEYYHMTFIQWENKTCKLKKSSDVNINITARKL